MQKQWIILALMIWLLSIGLVNAQDDSSFRVWSPIESITTESLLSDDAGIVVWELTIAGFHTDACEFDEVVEVNIFETNVDIQVFREIPINVTCLRDDTPFEVSLMVEIPMSELPLYVIVNDQVWEASWFDGDDETDVTLEEMALVGVVVDDVIPTFVEADADDDTDIDTYEFALMGSHGVGCDVPLVYSVRQLAEMTLIGVFNPVPELAVCPAMIIILDETIVVPATLLASDTLVTVNEFIIDELETQAVSNSNKVMTNINSVTVNVQESMPAQITLDISGEHPDGCDYPVMIDQEREDNVITLSIYRVVPTDVMCPMMLNPYEATVEVDGEFESGTYEIRVNGVIKSVDI